jgi:heme-degrading monooxygenase HmoA
MEDQSTLFIASFDVDAGREAEFEQWYRDVHVPDALGIPGYRSVRRYRNAGPFENADRGAKYLNIYELESLSAFAAGWDTDYRRRSSEDFNRWAGALSKANVGVYVADQGGSR